MAISVIAAKFVSLVVEGCLFGKLHLRQSPGPYIYVIYSSGFSVFMFGETIWVIRTSQSSPQILKVMIAITILLFILSVLVRFASISTTTYLII